MMTTSIICASQQVNPLSVNKIISPFWHVVSVNVGLVFYVCLI